MLWSSSVRRGELIARKGMVKVIITSRAGLFSKELCRKSVPPDRWKLHFPLRHNTWATTSTTQRLDNTKGQIFSSLLIIDKISLSHFNYIRWFLQGCWQQSLRADDLQPHCAPSSSIFKRFFVLYERTERFDNFKTNNSRKTQIEDLQIQIVNLPFYYKIPYEITF